MNGEEVERVKSFTFLGVQLSADLTWSTHISHQVGKAQQRLNFLRKLRQAHLPRPPVDKLLPLHHREPSDLLLYSVVQLLHCRGQEGPAAGGESSGAADWDDTTLL